MRTLTAIYVAAVDHYQTYWASRSKAAILEMSVQTRIRRLQLKIGLILAITSYFGFRLRNESGILFAFPYLYFALIAAIYFWKRRVILRSNT